jgi:hypothetical protein
LQRDDTSVLHNYEATMYCGVRGSTPVPGKTGELLAKAAEKAAVAADKESPGHFLGEGHVQRLLNLCLVQTENKLLVTCSCWCQERMPNVGRSGSRATGGVLQLERLSYNQRLNSLFFARLLPSVAYWSCIQELKVVTSKVSAFFVAIIELDIVSWEGVVCYRRTKG